MILLLFLLASIAGGSNTPLIKFAVDFYSPILLVLLRFSIGIIVLFPFVRLNFLKIKYSKSLFFANLLFALNILIFVNAIRLTSVIMAGLIYLLSSLVIALIGYFWLGEKIKLIQLFGLTISLAGMAILVFGSIQTNDILSFGTPLGNFLTIIAMLTWSIYVVISRKISSICSPQILTFHNFIITSIISIVLLPLDFINSFNLTITSSSIVSIFLLGTLSTVAFFYLFQSVNKKTSAFTSSLINYLATVFSSIFGILIFREKMTLSLIIGAIMVVSGVFSATSFTYLKARNK